MRRNSKLPCSAKAKRCCEFELESRCGALNGAVVMALPGRQCEFPSEFHGATFAGRSLRREAHDDRPPAILQSDLHLALSAYGIDETAVLVPGRAVMVACGK
jgi:hypothetical protein